MSRTMPLAGDYATAVQNPGFCFTDGVLAGSVIERNNLGQPRAMSGQFSVVFPVTSADGARHAVKCFTHDAPDQLRRYELLYRGLSGPRPRWATDFGYQPEGIQVAGESYPVLRLDWVEGTSLLTWLTRNGEAGAVVRLADEFGLLLRELAGAGIAHGDLQHGNILVQPDGTLRLIDYDGMYLPGVGLEEFPSDETGLPDYQPPGRSAADYGPAMDRFSAWLISLSLRALAVDPSLLEALNPERGEYLLLDRDDFADPWYSERMVWLDAHESQAARDLAERLRILLTLPLPEMPDPAAPWTYDGPLPPRPPRPARPKAPVKPPWLAAARPARPRVMPSPGSYAEAARYPRECFTSDTLREALIAKTLDGRAREFPGHSSVVFSATCGSQWYAVKCFTRDDPDRARRYGLVYQALSDLDPWWAVDFAYLDDEIRVHGQTYPVLRMDWAPEIPLMTWIEGHQDSFHLNDLRTQFLRLLESLADTGIAHGNLHPGNILVRPDGRIRLIDYDSLYVPGVGLEQFPSRETGLPGYQPPGRTAADYGPAMDRFSAWLILLSLEALAGDPSLIDVLNRSRGEYLLLNRDDFADPASSRSLALLDKHWSPSARQLAERVRILLTQTRDERPDPSRPWPVNGAQPPRRKPALLPPLAKVTPLPPPELPLWKLYWRDAKPQFIGLVAAVLFMLFTLAMVVFLAVSQASSAPRVGGSGQPTVSSVSSGTLSEHVG